MNAPDLEQAQRFLDRLHPNGSFSFQTFSESAEAKRRYQRRPQGKPPSDSLARVAHGTLGRHSKSLASKNAKGAGVYVMVNEGDQQGRSQASVQRVRAVFADFDNAEPGPAIAADPQPHIVVQSSPHGFHAYWIVEDCPLGEFKRVQRQIAALFGTDPKVCDLPRVMRLPGFMHCKGEPFRSKLLSVSNAAPYRLDELRFLRTDTGAPVAQIGVGFTKLDARWMDSQNWRTMVPQARDLFTIALGKYNGRNNGDISLAVGSLADYPAWHSRTTLNNHRQVLVERGWLVVAGHHGRVTLYAVTVHPIDDVRWPNGVRKVRIEPTTTAPDNWKRWRAERECMSRTRDIAPLKVA